MTLGLAVGLAGMACSLSKGEGSAESAESNATEADLLKSTIRVDKCLGTKVGDKHILIAASCVAFKEEFQPSKEVEVRAGVEDSQRKITIEALNIHPSYEKNCKDDGCSPTTADASKASDIAVIVTKDPLDGIESIPVDLDYVNARHALRAVAAVGENCADNPAQAVHATVSAGTKPVNHEGSPYAGDENENARKRLGTAYIVTAGEASLCAFSPGAPLFRKDKDAIVGVTSNATSLGEGKGFGSFHHTRVHVDPPADGADADPDAATAAAGDSDSPKKVGAWLEKLGVKTTRTCGTEGCPLVDTGDRPTDGGRRDGSSGRADSGAGNDDDAGTDDGDDDYGEDDGDDTSSTTTSSSRRDAGKSTTKKKAASGCSAAPGPISSSDGMLIGLGLAVAMVASRRRRSS